MQGCKLDGVHCFLIYLNIMNDLNVCKLLVQITRKFYLKGYEYKFQGRLFLLPNQNYIGTWTKSNEYMDKVQSVHRLHGLCPWTLSSPPELPGHFPVSTKSLDFVHELLDFVPGHCPVRLISLGYVHGLTGLFPECHWTLSRLSTESMVKVH